MSSRIIRGGDRIRNIKVISGGVAALEAEITPEERVMAVEKQAFEQGYQEGERIGKQMGERMIETAIKRYDRSVQELGSLHRGLADAMERETVQLALEIAKKVILREIAMDPDLVAALVSVSLKRVQGHHAITVRVSGYDMERVTRTMQTLNAAITVKEDSSLERGDFVLDTQQTHIDGRLASQIETVGRALFDES